ncbi:MAG: Gldg family protein [Candidatus Polarisedimenticolaceae bacterium]|nr:Gldg family protein [Candidatus Polarisedimenticolaceae bacterium]
MIITIARHELRRLLISPISWFILATLQLLLSWQFLVTLDQFNGLTSGQQQLGITSLLSLRLFGVASIVSLFTIPLLTTRLLSEEYHNGSFTLLRSAPISANAIIGGKYLALLVYLVVLSLIPALLITSIGIGTGLDWGLLSTALLGMLLLNASFAAIGLLFSTLCQQPSMATISSYGLLLLLSLTGYAGGALGWPALLEWFTWSDHLMQFQLGQIRSIDLIYFLLMIGLPLLLASHHLAAAGNWQRSLQSRFNHLLFPLLLVLSAALIIGLSSQYRVQWDNTATAGNSLSPQSIQLLTQLKSPLTITSFAPENQALRKQISSVIGRYQQHRTDIKLQFINPETEPSKAREQGITLAGELRLEYEGRLEQLQQLNERTLSNAILRLLGRPEAWILSLDGHGERTLKGKANFDLSEFNRALQANGHKSHNLNLTTTGFIPDNTGVLIIAGPRTTLTTEELKQIDDYLTRGGNLLLLVDSGSETALEPILNRLQMGLLPGIIVDTNGRRLGLENPAIAVITHYPEHAALDGFRLLTLFPQAKALEPLASNIWQHQALLITQHESWNETGQLQGEISHDAKADEQLGPLTLGLALSRERQTAQGPLQQRIIIIGGGDFLSNAFLANAGNQELGLRLIRWLSADDRQLVIPTLKRADSELHLSQTAKGVISFGTLIILPLLLLGLALFIPWRRRRC